jgi:hypothetical protein
MIPPLAFITLIVLVICSLLNALADFILFFILIYYKHYIAVLITVAIFTFIRTIWNYKTDIFAAACDQELTKDAQWIEDEEAINQLLIHEGPRYKEQKIVTSRAYAYTITWVPHTCKNRSTTLYSPSRRYKVTIQHTACRYYFLFQQNDFTVIWEPVNE